MDGSGNNATSHKESKIKSYTMSFKQAVAKFDKENSINSASMKFKADRKRIREWINNLQKISTKKQLEGGGQKPMIVEIEENLLEWIYERRSKMLYVSRKMIRIKAKPMFDQKTDDPAVQESFVASSGWIQNFMKRHHLWCRLISYLWYLVLIFERICPSYYNSIVLHTVA